MNNFKTAAFQLMVSKEIKELVLTFEKRSIKLLVIKGFPLSKLIYETESERQYADVDIYIDKTNLPQAIEALESLGYANIRGWIPESIALQIPMRKSASGINIDIDLHYELTSFPVINNEFSFLNCYENSIDFNVTEDTTAKTFSYEDAWYFSVYHIMLERKRGNDNTSRWETDIEKLRPYTKLIKDNAVKNIDKTHPFYKELSTYSAGKFDFLKFKFLNCNNRLKFIKETLFPPKGELSYTNKYTSRISRLLKVK